MAATLSIAGFGQTVGNGDVPAAAGAGAQPRSESELLLEDGPEPAGEQVRAPSSFWTALRMVLVLALAAAAVYGVVFFLKKMARPAEGQDPFLKVLASAHLGSNRFVHVVSLGERAWLVGASDGGVSSLGEVEDRETLDALFLEESRRAAEGQGRMADFKGLLRKLGGRTAVEGPRGVHTAAEKLRERRQKLRGL